MQRMSLTVAPPPPRTAHPIFVLEPGENRCNEDEPPGQEMTVTFYPDSGIAVTDLPPGVFRYMTPAESLAWPEPLRHTVKTKEEFRALQWSNCVSAWVDTRKGYTRLGFCLRVDNPVVYDECRWIEMIYHCPLATFKRRMKTFWRLWIWHKNRASRLAVVMSTHPRLGKSSVLDTGGLDALKIVCKYAWPKTSDLAVQVPRALWPSTLL